MTAAELKIVMIEDLEDRIAALEKLVAEQARLIAMLEDTVTRPTEAKPAAGDMP